MFSPDYIKPKLGTNVLQILHGYSTGFHFLISHLETSLFLISAGICSQIFSSAHDADSVPL